MKDYRLMKDYRRAVDYHNERLQGCDLMKDYRKVGTAGFPATHYSSGAPVYNPHATWVNCNKSKT